MLRLLGEDGGSCNRGTGWLLAETRGLDGGRAEGTWEDVGAKGEPSVFSGVSGDACCLSNRGRCPERCGTGDDRGASCGDGCRLECVKVERNAFRARTWRLASSEVPPGLTGLEKFMFLGREDGVRPTKTRELGAGLDKIFPRSSS